MQGTWNEHAAQSDANHPDESARRLLELLIQSLQWPDDEFQRRYPDVVAQIERDCRQQEEEWLDFLPAALAREHLEEHARMLGVMHHTALCVMQGDIATGRTAAFLLADWIRAHADAMDKPLAEAVPRRHRPRSSSREDLIDIRRYSDKLLQ